jgi:glycosyltransferase involved in cell wall biosynthesis
MGASKPSLLILGTRGIPAAHGGFETFAERLALFLTGRGWDVAVYCQRDVTTVNRSVWSDRWNGIERINVEVATRGPKGTLAFDWACIRDAAARPDPCLVLGYNSAVFLPWLRLSGSRIITNMDGIEWRRPKWSLPVRGWFWINEWIAAWTSHRLVADHPAIARHLATRRSPEAILTIPYGGVPILDAPEEPVRALGLEPDRFFVSIARIEPDNNIHLLVEAFSRQRRGMKLAILGTLDPENRYHRAVRAAAGDEVVFTGPIYDPAIVGALRFHARAYLHGHTVGGTNPSLVEALWAGNAVIAHDNPFNRWTAGQAALFFADVDSCAAAIESFVTRDDLLERARSQAREHAAALFDWTHVLEVYEREIMRVAAVAKPESKRPLGRPWSGRVL